jgi:hypothetical protein
LRAHLVGSVPLADSAAVFRTLADALGAGLARMPDGETGVRRSWIRFLQDVLAEHSGIEVARDLPPFRFVQWDGKLVREIPRLRVTGAAPLDADGFATGYADMAIDSWRVFEALQTAGEIPAQLKFQICMPTPIAPTYNNMLPADRPPVLAALTRHLIGEVERIAAALPNERIAVQWDVCQEVLAWEGYYEEGPVDFRSETLQVLSAVGNAVPAGVELGYHLCYGSPLDEHLVQPKDMSVLVEIANAMAAQVARDIQFIHMPVPRTRSDDSYFAPLQRLALAADTELYLGLIHHDDADGDAARLAAARKYARIDGVGAECGMGRGDPGRLDAMLKAHMRLLEPAA